MKKPCACCGCFTVYENHDICPVCFWEEDKSLISDEETGGANSISLKTARANYALYGACEERFASLVRAPNSDEIP